MDHETALGIVREYTQSESLARHMLAVEADMRAYARKYSENQD
jgi:predicted hydrolase (HD superfamily)